MGRIRTIKPEFPQSESIGRVSREARLCFLLLFTVSDDHGKLRGNARMLASLLYPYDDDAPKLIEKWLGQLVAAGCIVRYAVEGDSYIRIVNWEQHQKVDRPSPSKFPDPREGLADAREDSRGLDDGSRTKDQGRDHGSRTREGSSDRADSPDWLPLPEWEAFRKFRRKIKHPLTAEAEALAVQELDKLRAAGNDPAAVLNQSILRGWRGLFAIKHEHNQKGQGHGRHSGFTEQDYRVGTEGFIVA